ncbi:MAG: UDP-N-acetylmuramate dehydrogenase [Bacteroidales bacterium]
MNFTKNQCLKPFNTFGFNVSATKYIKVNDFSKITELWRKQQFEKRHLILGGGSNILFTKDFNGLVIHIQNKGIEAIKKDKDTIYVEAQAGEIWEDFVRYTIKNNWGGLENLSLIPGTVGACPIQNIGAYGVEVKDLIHKVKVFDKNSGNTLFLYSKDCNFGYRNSIFKNELKDKYIIQSVTFALNLSPKVNISYGNIAKELQRQNIENATIKDIGRIIEEIRNAKIPTPAKLGNAGSFFKNPIISNSTFATLKKSFPEIVSFPIDEHCTKIAAAWLIDQCGWKAFKNKNVGVYEKQALILVHFGEGSGKEIVELSHKIIASVEEKFGIKIEPEVNFI